MSRSSTKSVSCGLDYCEESLQNICSISGSIEEATSNGYDFVTIPITQSKGHEGEGDELLLNLPDTDTFTYPDLTMQSNDWNHLVVGKLSSSIDMDSDDEAVRATSEVQIERELMYASHLGLPAVLLQLKSERCYNLARYVTEMACNIYSHITLWVEIPMVSTTDGSEGDADRSSPWNWWNTFRTMCSSSMATKKIFPVVSISADLPSDEELERFLAEPLKAAVLDTDIFISNQKGYPVLTKTHQRFMRRLIKKLPTSRLKHFLVRPNSILLLEHFSDKDLNTQFIIRGPCRHDKPNGMKVYWQYMSHVFLTQPPLDIISQFAKGYEDYLQSPLQVYDARESTLLPKFWNTLIEEKGPIRSTVLATMYTLFCSYPTHPPRDFFY